MMHDIVMDGRDMHGHAQTVKLTARLRSGSLVSLVLFVSGWLIAPSYAQAGDSGKFKIKVLDTAATSQRVEIPLNRSVIIETSIEVARADVVASDIADVKIVSPTQLFIAAKEYGNTNIILWDKSDEQYVLEVSVDVDLNRLKTTIQAIDPQSRVEASSFFGNIVLTGTVSSVEHAQRITELATLVLPSDQSGIPLATVQNHLVVAGEQQVLLRCVVAEMSRSAGRELGINGFLAGENVRDGFLVNQLGGINPISIGAAGGASATGAIPFLTDITGIPISPQSNLSLGFPRVQMQLFLRALADNSLATILAEPNLVAVSGETATFLAGGEFPIPVPQGNQQVTIEFREFGIRLNFTPVVKGHQIIRLRVRPEVSELDFQTAVQIEGFLVPGLTSRSMETTVEVGSGQTIAIAGLLSEEVRGLATRVPGIGDVPILGALFRSVNFQRSLTELVILVTPEIVAPLEVHQVVKIPGEDRSDPTDMELYALGLLEGAARPGAESPFDPAGDQASDSNQRWSSDPERLSLHGPWGHSTREDLR